MAVRVVFGFLRSRFCALNEKEAECSDSVISALQLLFENKQFLGDRRPFIPWTDDISHSMFLNALAHCWRQTSHCFFNLFFGLNSLISESYGLLSSQLKDSFLTGVLPRAMIGPLTVIWKVIYAVVWHNQPKSIDHTFEKVRCYPCLPRIVLEHVHFCQKARCNSDNQDVNVITNWVDLTDSVVYMNVDTPR